MFYIHDTACISPQQTFIDITLGQLNKPSNNKLTASEPSYTTIPPNILRRMGKAVRIAIGAAMPLVQQTAVDGFIIGTANGGMEDCIKFLNQIISYDEGMLTPGNFVQSTPNAIASQISLLTNNKAYNITHVHRGLAFENAMLDAAMQLNENPARTFLVGGVDEISSYNYNIDKLDGWYRQEPVIENTDLYATDRPGSIAGEGAAMFLVNNNRESSVAQLKGIGMIHSENEQVVAAGLQSFISKYLPAGEKIDLFLTGENGDNRLLKYYTTCEDLMAADVTIARCKHLSGEYPTAAAFMTWLACQLLKKQEIPPHLLKKGPAPAKIHHILIYNNYKGYQHSYLLLSL